ncbi:alpha/beta family hydrolase [Rhodococcus sp. HNM0569]|uniref:alpha/beta hydrolase family protein n=1 Tax=Rhodococcus sp. HNM0569 TaxID=2716340 RepID=UPI00146CDAD6|nr:alpha/beta family hydrolase [Rhodococcus sp. HNM0569]NLU83730.1 alpha/beta hydrolase [Rhodococcus sp. HNM0569]
MTVEEITGDGVHGWLHRPDGDVLGGLAFAHGAGGDAGSALLVALAEAFAERGVLTLRYDLPYRQRRPKGPPQPARAEADRAGVAAALEVVRELFDGPLVAGGQSYGGRQTSMLLAEQPGLIDRLTLTGLLLTSYPLHAPGKPDKQRTEHLPDLRVPTVVVHGSKDTFATTDEIERALALIPAPTTLVDIAGGRHDLAPGKSDVVARAAEAGLRLFE